MRGDAKGPRRFVEGLVRRPERAMGQKAASEQVDVNPAETAPMEAMVLQQMKEFRLVGHFRLRQRIEQTENLAPVPEPPTRQFADHKGMAEHLAFIEQLLEPGMSAA